MSVVLDVDPEVVALRRQVRELQEEIEEWKRRSAGLHGDDADEQEFEPPREWRLSRSEALVLRVLVERQKATRQLIAMAFEDRHNGHWEAETKIIDVFVCKMRHKLASFGVTIETIWGEGYRLPPEVREGVARACAGGSPVVGAPVTEGQYGGLTAEVERIVCEAGRPLNLAAVNACAIEAGLDPSYNTVGGVLQALHAAGRVSRSPGPDPKGRRAWVWFYSPPPAPPAVAQGRKK